jgi:hypothetical protein
VFVESGSAPAAGELDGDADGDTVGEADGDTLGEADGDTLGEADGDALGEADGDTLGDVDGEPLGDGAGAGGGAAAVDVASTSTATTLYASLAVPVVRSVVTLPWWVGVVLICDQYVACGAIRVFCSREVPLPAARANVRVASTPSLSTSAAERLAFTEIDGVPRTLLWWVCADGDTRPVKPAIVIEPV